METSSIIVMYAGTTHWVGWELQRIIEGGFTDKLIILFPPVLPFPFLARLLAQEAKGGHQSALSAHQDTFAGTKWAETWDVAEPETIICARLGADGTIAFTRSRRRSKDAYDLAAKVAHLGILGLDPKTLDHEPNGVPAAP